MQETLQQLFLFLFFPPFPFRQHFIWNVKSLLPMFWFLLPKKYETKIELTLLDALNRVCATIFLKLLFSRCLAYEKPNVLAYSWQPAFTSSEKGKETATNLETNWRITEDWTVKLERYWVDKSKSLRKKKRCSKQEIDWSPCESYKDWFWRTYFIRKCTFCWWMIWSSSIQTSSSQQTIKQTAVFQERVKSEVSKMNYVVMNKKQSDEIKFSPEKKL